MKKLFMCLTFLSPLSFAGIPTIDVANLVENDVKPLVWALNELKAIGANVDDLEIIDYTFPCKVVYQTKSNKSVLVHVTSDFEEPIKTGSLCENPLNIKPDDQTIAWAQTEISNAGLNIKAVKVIDISYPCKMVYQADSDLAPKLYIPESSKTNEACIKKPIPLSEAEQKRQLELKAKMDEMRANKFNDKLASYASNIFFLVLIIGTLIFILFRKSGKRNDYTIKDE
jgi:hypothetical protein